MISRRDVIVGYVLLSLAALISLGPLIGVVILALGELEEFTAEMLSELRWYQMRVNNAR